MITDWHAHYPMHVIDRVTPNTALEMMRKGARRPTLKDKIRALILRIASIFFSHSHPFSGYRVTAKTLRAGDVRVVLSVLYRPAAELDPSERFGAPPKSSYFGDLMDDLEEVETEVGNHDRSQIRTVHRRTELDACVDDGATALIHSVEGGFHLGTNIEDIDGRVEQLAQCGVAYITVAHLFFRGVAAVAPALPFLSDEAYDCLFPQRAGDGLTALAEATIRAMAKHRILVDVSHMRGDALNETFQLLDEVDPERSLPVISTHAGYRFEALDYMHDERTIQRIADRNGLVGLIMAQHQLLDGLMDEADRPPADFAESFGYVRRHIDEIARIIGDHRHVAIGSDFDGFVKPTMTEIENSRDLKTLEDALRAEYGEVVANQIAYQNTLDVLHRLWR